ncbi:MAG TPA: hypothetical protein VJB92_00050 [Candidatus Paceibacterota bacterium]
MAEIVTDWPKRRNPIPPFFVSKVGNACFIAGTVAEGVLEGISAYSTVPMLIPRWDTRHQLALSEQEAVEVADFLNRLNEEGLIEWDWRFSRVLPEAWIRYGSRT